MAKLTTTDKKDLEICKNILALYNQLSKKCQKNIHDLTATYPFAQSTKVWCMGEMWKEAIEKLENGEKNWWE